ncbi:MAG: MFS transporter [Bacteroidales bacterium]
MKKTEPIKYNPKHLRWIVLILTGVTYLAFTMFSDYFNSLKDQLSIHLNFSSTDYGIFQSAYGFPNVFLGMTIIGGITVDKLGIRLSGLITSILAFIGVLITGYGASSDFNSGGFGYHFLNSFLKGFSPGLKMMCIGFFFLGLGLENVNLIITKIIVRWFKDSKMALALSINISLARLGTALAISAAPLLVTSAGFGGSIKIAVLVSFLGLITYAIYLGVETKRVKKEKELGIYPKKKSEAESDPEEVFKWKDVRKLIKNPAFIFITLLCVTFYSAFVPFLKYAPDLLHNKFMFPDDKAGIYTSALPIGTIIFGPIFGYLVDKKGHAINIMLVGALLMIFAFISLGFTKLSPVASFILLGASFSLVPAAMWPTVARISPMRTLGTAYGVIFFIQNFGLWLFAFLPGYILDISNPKITPEQIAKGTAYYNYTWTIVLLLFLGAIALIFALALIYTNKKHKMKLNSPLSE